MRSGGDPEKNWLLTYATKLKSKPKKPPAELLEETKKRLKLVELRRSYYFTSSGTLVCSKIGGTRSLS